jgi:selenocysteine-specific elongation factor
VLTLVLGTAGHIDHGKSALVEALTGTHPDRLREEQARGITIELGFAHARIGDVAVALVDVPGHERFVRTMLAGAGGLDAVLLVIAANESVMPQTREHFDICRLLGVERGLIVLTKKDLVDADGLALAELEARELVAGTPLAGAPVLAVSAHTGEGLPALRAAVAALADQTPGVVHSRSGVTRVPIDRAFSVKGFGTVVTGTLVGGALEVDEALALLPAGRAVRVRGIQVHGQTVTRAEAPRRVAVNLAGVDLDEVHRGMTLAAPGSLAVTRRVDVRITLLTGSSALRHGAQVRVHQGTGECAARVLLAATRGSEGAPWMPVAPGDAEVALAPGEQAFARLRLSAPMVLARGDRFVLRLPSPARTIGGGVVIDPEPGRGGVRRTGAVARFVHTDGVPVDEAVAVWMADAGLAGLTIADVARRGGVAGATAEATLNALVIASRGILCGAHVVSPERLSAAAARLVSLLAAYHQAHPAEAGMSREEARARVAPHLESATFEVIVSLSGAVAVAGAERLALPSHRTTVSDEDTRVREVVVAALRDAALLPPDVNGLAAMVGTPPAEVQRAVLALMKESRVVRLAGLWFDAGALAALKISVASLGAGAVMDVAAAKARFGVSRKFAIPLLEYLDRERVTRRVGDKRLVL